MVVDGEGVVVDARQALHFVAAWKVDHEREGVVLVVEELAHQLVGVTLGNAVDDEGVVPSGSWT